MTYDVSLAPIWYYGEFRQKDLQREKIRVPELSCGVVCVIPRLAVSLEHRLVTHDYGFFPLMRRAVKKLHTMLRLYKLRL